MWFLPPCPPAPLRLNQCTLFLPSPNHTLKNPATNPDSGQLLSVYSQYITTSSFHCRMKLGKSLSESYKEALPPHQKNECVHPLLYSTTTPTNWYADINLGPEEKAKRTGHAHFSKVPTNSQSYHFNTSWNLILEATVFSLQPHNKYFWKNSPAKFPFQQPEIKINFQFSLKIKHIFIFICSLNGMWEIVLSLKRILCNKNAPFFSKYWPILFLHPYNSTAV